MAAPNRPRESVLNLFDPLFAPPDILLHEPSDSEDEFDPEKENAPPSSVDLSLTAFFTRSSKSSITGQAGPRKRLIDVGDATVDESSLPMVNEEEEEEDGDLTIQQLDQENAASDLTLLKTPVKTTRALDSTVSSSPRTPLAELPLERDGHLPVKEKGPMRPFFSPKSSRTLAPSVSTEAQPPESSLSSFINEVNQKGLSFAAPKPQIRSAFQQMTFGESVASSSSNPPDPSVPFFFGLPNGLPKIPPAHSFCMEIQSPPDVTFDILRDEISFGRSKWNGGKNVGQTVYQGHPSFPPPTTPRKMIDALPLLPVILPPSSPPFQPGQERERATFTQPVSIPESTPPAILRQLEILRTIMKREDDKVDPPPSTSMIDTKTTSVEPPHTPVKSEVDDAGQSSNPDITFSIMEPAAQSTPSCAQRNEDFSNDSPVQTSIDAPPCTPPTSRARVPVLPAPPMKSRGGMVTPQRNIPVVRPPPIQALRIVKRPKRPLHGDASGPVPVAASSSATSASTSRHGGVNPKPKAFSRPPEETPKLLRRPQVQAASHSNPSVSATVSTVPPVGGNPGRVPITAEIIRARNAIVPGNISSRPRPPIQSHGPVAMRPQGMPRRVPINDPSAGGTAGTSSGSRPTRPPLPQLHASRMLTQAPARAPTRVPSVSHRPPAVPSALPRPIHGMTSSRLPAPSGIARLKPAGPTSGSGASRMLPRKVPYSQDRP